MAGIIDTLNGKERNSNIQPLFITCDPARDDPASLKKYLAGMTFTLERADGRISSRYGGIDRELG
jgi:cytochrome oxidase Cu insertion factor (SCO1/SenC/PrrC family)